MPRHDDQHDQHDVHDVHDVLSSGSERGERGPVPRALAYALVAVVVLGAGVAGFTRHRPDPPRRHPAPVALPSPSTTLPAVRTWPRSTSTDLSTTVTDGYVRIPGLTFDEQVAQVSAQMSGETGISATYWFTPDSRPGMTSPGLHVEFTSLLTPDAAASFRRRLSAVKGADVELGAEQGTTVDISVRPPAGRSCTTGSEDPPAPMALDPGDMDLVGATLRTFSLHAEEGWATVSYAGPALTAVQMSTVGHLLAHSCQVPDQDVSLTRNINSDS